MEKMEGAATMADDKVILATFKIYPEDADWAAAEQRRLKREERRAVTQADLFSRLRARYMGAGDGRGAGGRPPGGGRGRGVDCAGGPGENRSRTERAEG